MAFDAIKLKWDGREYQIAPERVLRAIAVLEDIVTLDELQRFGERQSTPRSKLSQGYGAILRLAGAKVSDEEIYASLFGGESAAESAILATTGLLQLMVPPAHMRKGQSDPGKSSAAMSSSKRPTKS